MPKKKISPHIVCVQATSELGLWCFHICRRMFMPAIQIWQYYISNVILCVWNMTLKPNVGTIKQMTDKETQRLLVVALQLPGLKCYFEVLPWRMTEVFFPSRRYTISAECFRKALESNRTWTLMDFKRIQCSITKRQFSTHNFKCTLSKFYQQTLFRCHTWRTPAIVCFQ